MSGSSAFANYSNTTQQLSNSISQLAPTTKQITDDKTNFEQQFLIGASLMAKAKATDKLAGLFKKSKTIDSLKGKAEGEIRKVAKSAQDRAEGLAKDLVNKVKGVARPEAPSTPDLNPSASPENLEQLKGISDEASETAKGTAKALEDANNDMIDTRQAVKDASDLRDAQEAIVNSNTQRAVSQAGGRISAQQQINDANARSELNDARSGVEAAEQRAQEAEDTRNALSEQLQQHQSTADQAAQDVQKAGSAAKDVETTETAASDTEKALNVTKDVEEGEKALKVAKDVEETATATSEADPLGLVFAGLAAIATQIIGRKMKVHQNIISAPVPPTTFGDTLGA